MKRRLFYIIMLMIASLSGNAQRLEDCQELYNGGLWNEAEAAYNDYIATLEPNSLQYYIALSNYGELLYHLDRRDLSDSLLRLSSQKITKSLYFGEERLRSISRYSSLSGQSKFGAWLRAKIGSMDNKSDLLDDGETPDFVREASDEIDDCMDPIVLMLEGERSLRNGFPWVAKLKFIKAEQRMHFIYGADYARLKICWARYYFTTTNYNEMLTICGEAMQILEDLGFQDGVFYTDAMLYTAVAMGQLGNHKGSIEMFDEVLRRYGNTLGKNNSRYALALYHYGQVMGATCDIDRMIELELLSAQTYKNAIGENTPEYASALNEIGVAYSMMGDTINEFNYYLKSLEINKKYIGEGSYQTARQCYNISVAYARLGNYAKAMEYIKTAHRLAMVTTGVNSVFTADCVTQRAYINLMQGNPKTAKVLISSVIGIYTNLDEQSLKRASALNIQGNCDYMSGKYDKASEKLTEAASIYRKNLMDNFSFMTSQTRNRYWENSAGYFHDITKLCWKQPEDEQTLISAYNCELISKGIELNSEIEFANIIGQSHNKALQEKYGKLQEYRQQILSESDVPKEDRQYNSDSLSHLADELEKELVRDSKEYGDLTRPIKVQMGRIAKALGDGEAAIEFIKTPCGDSTMYGALIVKHGWKAPKFVSLFSSAQYDRYYKDATAIKPYTNTNLYKMVWEPLEKHLDIGGTIYFAPTGLLYNTAIEYAPISDYEDVTISEKYTIHRISSTRNIVLGKPTHKTGNAVVYGGIYYDTDPTTMLAESNMYSKREVNNGFLRNYFSRNGGINVNYLPGTEKEAEAIVKYLIDSDYATTYYTHDKANEESFKNLSGSDFDIIHIATHGFYLDEEKSQLKGDNNLLFSGLLMSGCNNINRLPSGIDDGVLTAREISYLDFRKTDIVVLSACETGLGKITDEGVYGLQRGFKKAGVNTIIMSLWPVNDYATKLLMTEFYKNLVAGYDKREAFMMSQRALRAKNGVNPSHWAAFIMLD